MSGEDSSGPVAGDVRQVPAPPGEGPRRAADDDIVPVPERRRAVRRALADARELAQLQVEVLARLDEADHAGDDAAVQRCHAELDHVMAMMAEIEQVRTGARVASPEAIDMACAGCGAAAEPVYETPRLLRYTCTTCGWTGHDPAAQAARKHAEAKDAAAAAVGRAVPAIEEALAMLDRRGKLDRNAKKARDQGISALRAVHESLAAAGKRLRAAPDPAGGRPPR